MKTSKGVVHFHWTEWCDKMITHLGVRAWVAGPATRTWVSISALMGNSQKVLLSVRTSRDCSAHQVGRRQVEPCLLSSPVQWRAAADLWIAFISHTESGECINTTEHPSLMAYSSHTNCTKTLSVVPVVFERKLTFRMWRNILNFTQPVSDKWYFKSRIAWP